MPPPPPENPYQEAKEELLLAQKHHYNDPFDGLTPQDQDAHYHDDDDPGPWMLVMSAKQGKILEKLIGC